MIPQQPPSPFRSWGRAWTADLRAWCLSAAIRSWENCFYRFRFQIPRTESQRQQKAHASLSEKETKTSQKFNSASKSTQHCKGAGPTGTRYPPTTGSKSQTSCRCLLSTRSQRQVSCVPSCRWKLRTNHKLALSPAATLAVNFFEESRPRCPQEQVTQSLSLS